MKGIEGDRLIDVDTHIYARKERIMTSVMSKMVGTVRAVSGRPRTVSILRRKVGTALFYHLDGTSLQVIRRLCCRRPSGLMHSKCVVGRDMIPIVAFVLAHPMRVRTLSKRQHLQQWETRSATSASTEKKRMIA